MISPVQFGINQHLWIFQKLQIALALQVRVICSHFKYLLVLFYPKLYSKPCDYQFAAWEELILTQKTHICFVFTLEIK